MNSYTSSQYGNSLSGSFKKPIPPASGASPAYMAKVLGIKSVKSRTPVLPPPPKPSRKRPRLAPSKDDNDDDEDAEANERAEKQRKTVEHPLTTPQKGKNKAEKSEEKRLRKFRQKPPQSYLERLERVQTQRMFLIERKRTMAEDGTHEEEEFDIAGSTGNVYKVTISKVPTCNCPDSQKGNHCKHIVYVMVNVLKAPEDLAYQLALLSTELATIFANAPITQALSNETGEPSLATDTGGCRKPIEGDCPVCVMPFEEGDDLVWCKAACGQNIHRECFGQWQRSKPGQVAKCVFCRSVWKGETKDIGKAIKSASVNDEGYVNLAGELGLSGERDMRTYHLHWVARQYGSYYRRRW